MMKNNRFTKHIRFSTLVLGVFFLMFNCQREPILNDTNTNANLIVDQLKNYIETNGSSNFYENIEWEKATVRYYIKDKPMVYVPLKSGNIPSEITLGAIKTDDTFFASYTFRSQENSGDQIKTTTIYNIKGNFVACFKTKKTDQYIRVKAFGYDSNHKKVVNTVSMDLENSPLKMRPSARRGI